METLSEGLYSYFKLFSEGVNLLYKLNPSKNDLVKYSINITPFSNNEIELREYVFTMIDRLRNNELKRLDFLKTLFYEVVSVLGNESIVRYDELNLKCSTLDPFYDIPLESLDKDMLITKVGYFLKKVVHGLRFSLFQVLSSNCDFFKDIEHKSFKLYLDEYFKNLMIKEAMIKLEKGIQTTELPEEDIKDKDEATQINNKEFLKGLYRFSPKNNNYLYDYLSELDEKFLMSDPKKCFQNVFSAIALIIYESGVIIKGVTYISFLEALCGYYNRPVPKEVKKNKYREKAAELKSKHHILESIPFK